MGLSEMKVTWHFLQFFTILEKTELNGEKGPVLLDPINTVLLMLKI